MNNIIDFFIHLQSQLRIMHWQTKSYARHVAYGMTYDAISDLADKFIEAYQGRYGRIQCGTSIEIANINDEKLSKLLDECLEFLNNQEKLGIKDGDTDLSNIRDEIIGTINKLKYLLTLE